MVVVFWQNRPSIHQQPLLTELSKLGVKVIQVVAEGISPERAAMGWEVRNAVYETRMCQESDPLEVLARYPDAYHVFSGFQAFPSVGRALDVLYARVPQRCYVFQERPDIRGRKGWLRRFLYRWYCFKYRYLGGILAAGSLGFFSRVAGNLKVFQFPYYVYPPDLGGKRKENPDAPFRFLYIGALIHRKNIDGLCTAFRELPGPWELVVVGQGPQRINLEALAKERPECQILLRGVLSNTAIGQELRESDCLVLPSRFDGYGVVVNEAALSGLRIVCSSMAGASEVLRMLDLKSWMIDPSDPKDILRGLKMVMSSGHLTANEIRGRREAVALLQPSNGAKWLKDIMEGKSDRIPCE